MNKIMGVQFQKNGKMYYFDANGIEAQNGSFVVVDTVRGVDLGEVVLAPREITTLQDADSLKKVIRIATEQDILHGRENRIREKEAFGICQKKIAEHKLEMKLVSVEYSFDGSKILFYFTANGRVDFRSLVKDLASVFKMRIELRQIGVRDEAKMLGGLGPCGRTICCGSFLTQFQPVSIKMAKEQNLSLNPTKISGVCGRLMCCLKYEQDHYEQTRKKMPKVGRSVTTPDGTGPVTELNIVKETVFVRLTNGDTNEIKEYPLESITKQVDIFQQEKTGLPGHLESDNTDIQMTKTEDNAEQSDNTYNREEQRSQNRNRNRVRNHQLGQPVKRENPNRTSSMNALEKNDKVNREPVAEFQGENTKDSQAVYKGQKSASSSWADAVQNAMKAIDKE